MIYYEFYYIFEINLFNTYFVKKQVFTFISNMVNIESKYHSNLRILQKHQI